MIIAVLGRNGSGKTTFVSKLRHSIFKDKQAYRVIPRDAHIDPEVYFEEICGVILNKFRNCLIIFDDLDTFRPYKSANFKNLLINARHLGIDIIFTSRRHVFIQREAFESSDYIILFNLHPADLDFFVHFYDPKLINPTKVGEYIVINNKLQR